MIFTFIHVMKEGERVNEDGTLSYPLPLIKSQEKTFAVCQIIEEDLKAGNVEQMAEEPRFKGSEWYLPPFVVTHKRKGTPRLVFDAAAECQSTSLNKLLLQGPDMLSKLRHVLLRFREKRVCITGDIKGIFELQSFCRTSQISPIFLVAKQ